MYFLSIDIKIIFILAYPLPLNPPPPKKLNKRPMGHITHLRKQFKSINTYYYIITLIKRRKKPLLILGEFIGSSFKDTWIPFTQGCFVPRLVEIGSVVLEKKIFKFRHCLFTISQLSPLGNGRGPSFEQTWIPFILGCFVPSLVEIGSVVLEKKIFKFCQCI